MRVLQVLPSLHSGGVERGTVDFAQQLVKQGHESIVMSSGGPLAQQIIDNGSRHIEFPVHQKSLKSLFYVRRLRQLILEIKPDIIHVRSRVPAWMVWLAVKKIPKEKKPRLVSTFHSLYSVNAYSEIMGCGEHIIAISECVRDYITENYPKLQNKPITVVHRGVNTEEFSADEATAEKTKTQLFAEHPQMSGKHLIAMPGRITRWKGHQHFIDLIEDLVNEDDRYHGVIIGGPSPGKESYLEEIKRDVRQRQLQQHITFLGHRSDINELYRCMNVICNLSTRPEPFGRTVIEALAMGTPVVAFNQGGPAESLRDCLPQGLVEYGDRQHLMTAVQSMVNNKPEIRLPPAFTLNEQSRATMAIYEKIMAD